jgi:rhodanese-related sulfurtransferase
MPQMSSTREIDIEQFASANPSGTVVDVRERAEFASGHVPGARLIPMGHLAARMRELDRTGPVYVICATGNRSLAMTDLLRGAGFDAYSVAGGTVAWAQSGRSVEGGLA